MGLQSIRALVNKGVYAVLTAGVAMYRGTMRLGGTIQVYKSFDMVILVHRVFDLWTKWCAMFDLWAMGLVCLVFHRVMSVTHLTFETAMSLEFSEGLC